MKKILCIGQSTHDTTYVLDGYPHENSKVKAINYYSMGGGSAGNAAYLLAKFGEKVSLVSTFGTDEKGQKIKNEYESIGIDIKNCIIKDEYTTPVSTILTNARNGSRTIVGYRKKNIIPPDYCVECVHSPELLYSDGYDIDLIKRIMDKFPDVTLILDAGGLKQEFLDLARQTAYFICSEDFAKEYTKLDNIDENNFEYVFKKLEELNNQTIVVTMGERGCLYKERGELKRMPAFKANVVDTTAAGDIFHAAFTYGLSQGFFLEKCIKFASACSAVSVSRIGGRTSIPELHEVIDMMANGELLS